MTIVAEAVVRSEHRDIRGRMRERLVRALDGVSEVLARRIRDSLRISNQDGMYTAQPGESPHFGIGDLLKSIYWRRVDEMTRFVGVRGSGGDSAGLPYARLQEFGGWIRIKSKQWLTIPVSREARRHKTHKRSAREFPRPLFFMHTADPTVAYLCEAGSNSELPTIHYLLKKKVFVPAHPYLRPAAHDPEFRQLALRILGGTASGMEVEALR